MSRTSWPRPIRTRAQLWPVAQASIPIRHEGRLSKNEDIAPAELPPKDNRAARVDTVNVENVFGDIQTDRRRPTRAAQQGACVRSRRRCREQTSGAPRPRAKPERS